MVALCRAAATYDPAGGAKFSTYAGVCILNGLRSETISESRHLVASEAIGPAGEYPHEPICPRSEEGFRLADARDEASRALARLHPADRIKAMLAASRIEAPPLSPAEAGLAGHALERRRMHRAAKAARAAARKEISQP